MFKKRSFMEKLTGSLKLRDNDDYDDSDLELEENEDSDEDEETRSLSLGGKKGAKKSIASGRHHVSAGGKGKDWQEQAEDEEAEGQLTVKPRLISSCKLWLLAFVQKISRSLLLAT
jgi:hypothetical protein